MDAYDSLESEFQDSPNYVYVLQSVKKQLIAANGLNITNANHPFNKYADESCCTSALIARLRADVLNILQEPKYREIVTAFFHGGGAYRDQIEELMDAYWEYVDSALNIT